MLANLAERCDADTLKEVLLNKGHNPAFFNAISRGVERDYKSQDRGSYCENASLGYYNAAEKMRLMEDYIGGVGDFKNKLSQSFLKKGQSSSQAPSIGDKLDQILETLQDITARVQTLEDKATSTTKPSLKNNL